MKNFLNSLYENNVWSSSNKNNIFQKRSLSQKTQEQKKPENTKIKNSNYWNIGLIFFLILVLIGTATAKESNFYKVAEPTKEDILKTQKLWHEEEEKKKVIESKMNEYHNANNDRRGKLKATSEVEDVSLEEWLQEDYEKIMKEKPEKKKIDISFSGVLEGKNKTYIEGRAEDILNFAYENGIKEEWKMRALFGFLFNENGAMTEDRFAGGGEDSFGLCMCNITARGCNAETKKSGRGYILGDYNSQKNICTKWFSRYTEKSSQNSVYNDIRGGHNSRASDEYTRKMKMYGDSLIFE